MTNLRRAFVAASIVWAVLLPLAPFAASQPAPARFWYALAFGVYGAGSFVCHQLPLRSFHLWWAQLPVCARCTGIYVGAAVTAIVVTVRLPSLLLKLGKPDTTYASRRARWLLALGALPNAMTLIHEWATGDTPSNVVRALAGVPLGAAVAFIVVEALRIRSAGGATSWGPASASAEASADTPQPWRRRSAGPQDVR